MEPGGAVQDFGFFISVCLVGIVAYFIGGLLDARRRAVRRGLTEGRNVSPDREFELGISALNPVPANFGGDFRKAVGSALGVDPQRLEPQDRILGDLRVFGFDAIELASALERAFDVRVRVIDVVRAGTLRKLAMLVHERLQDISEAEPPLHRDPVPKVTPPAADAPTTAAIAPPPVENP